MPTHDELFINYNNYKDLLAGIIYQAAMDYNYILKEAKKHGQEGKILAEKRVGSQESIEKFFLENGGCFTYIDMDSPSLLHQMQRNFSKYGMCLIKDDDWKKINMGEGKK